jgi:hypothetical protein
MPFDTGSISFRVFHLDRAFDSSITDDFARHAIPPIETLHTEPLTGWVSSRHLLDRDLTEEKILHAGYVNLQLLRAEKKIPEALLRAHCRLEEEVERKARNIEFLPRAIRAEIKDRVRDELLPAMPPTLAGIPVCVDLRNQRLLAQAMSDAKIDFLTAHFRETTGTTPRLLTPDDLALRRVRVNVNDLATTRYSPDDSLEDEHELSIGMDFLTWLWFNWEKHGGVFKHGNLQFGYMLEGPLTFFRNGAGAHEAVLRHGSPCNSREAFSALLCGKKLRRAKLLLAEGDTLFTATLDSDFAVRSLKLPKSEQPDPIGRFQERMLHIERFLDAFLSLYDRFLLLRADRKKWSTELDAIRAWIESRVK